MINIVTVVGARPQFVKAAVISREISGSSDESVVETIIHTGQHFDSNMSSLFFEELSIPAPSVNLALGSGSHGEMTGKMIERLEREFLALSPDIVLLYGDTNSTIAAALAATKIHIPVAHVEAGLRSFDRRMPEEVNRVVTDHLSNLLFAPTSVAMTNLQNENVFGEKELVGDVMYDAVLYYRKIVQNRTKSDRVASRFQLPHRYFLVTIHRAENTDDPQRLSSIFRGIGSHKDLLGVLPIHPRTAKVLKRHSINVPDNLKVVDPVGYLDMLELEMNADFIATDSGGVQKEAFFHGRPCITLRDSTEWVETLSIGANKLVGYDADRIAEAISSLESFSGITPSDIFGTGDAGSKVIKRIVEWISDNDG